MGDDEDIAKMSTRELLDALAAYVPEVPQMRASHLVLEAMRRLEASVADEETARQTKPSPTTTLEHCKLWLREHWHDGVDCPLCTRMVKLYPRRLGPSMASAVRTSYRTYGTAFGNITKVWSKNEHADATKLRYWGILEPKEGEVGVWRVTDFGVDWLAGRVTVPSHAHVFDTRCFGFSGEQVSIHDVMKGRPFDLAELMAERPFPPPSDRQPRLFKPI